MTLNFEQARLAMVEQQVRPWEVLDPRVLETIGAVPREDFVPAAQRQLAYADLALPLPHGECMLKPVLEGRLLQALAIAPSDEVLEIGTGSGYLTACLAQLARDVLSIDLHADFIATAAPRLERLGSRNVRLETADAFSFVPNRLFDAIAVTGAVASVPDAFARWLKPGGRLFVVRGDSPAQEAVCLTRRDEHLHIESLFETDIPYLRGAEPAPRFIL
jgi:protein-L-isoaspartate(D-aspartate) O-methyltransferase